jgi:hypothetical protein
MGKTIMAEGFGGIPVEGFGGTPKDVPKTGTQQASEALSGTYEGLAEVLGLPVDLVAAGMGAMGVGGGDAIGGSESLKKLFGAVGAVKPAQPGYGFERRVGKEVGAAIPFVGGMGAAARGVKIVSKAAKGLPQAVGRAMVEPAVQAPLKTAAGEMVAATGAGIGAATAQAIAPGSMGAEITGQLAGGIAPSVLLAGPTGMALRGAKTLAGKVSPTGRVSAAKENLQAMMGEELTPGVMERMKAGQQTAAQVPGFEPSIGEVSGSPSLMAMQRAQETGLTGAKLEKAVARQDKNIQAINDFAESVAPSGPVDVDVVIDSARGKVRALTGEISAAGVSSPAELPSANLKNIGAKMRDNLIERRREASEAMGQIADEMGLNQIDITPQYEGVREELITAMTPAGRFATEAHTPEIVSTLIKDRGVTASTSLEDMKGLREAISNEYRASVTGAAPDLQRARYLKIGLHQIDKAMDDLVFPEELASLYPEWRKAYFDNVIDKFDRGAAFAVRKKGQKGFFVTDDERVASSFFGSKKGEAMSQYSRIFGDSADDMDAMRSVILDDFRTSVVRDGEIKPRLMESWFKRYGSTLDEIPQVRDELMGIEDATKAMGSRMRTLDARQRKIEDSVLTRSLKAYSKGTKTGTQVVADAVAKPRLMRQLVNSIRKDPDAMAGLRRHVWDDIVSNDATAMRANMDDNIDSLKMVLTPNHMKNLDTIIDARIMAERAPTPTGTGAPGGMLEAAEKQLGMGTSQLGSRIFAVKSGRIGVNYMMTDIFGRFFKGQSAQSVERMLDEALYDPEVAKLLVDGLKSPTSKRVTNHMKKYMFNLGLESRKED